MGDYIADLLGDIEYNMRFVPASDPYFEELSIQKFTLEQLLREIDRHEGDSPTTVVARFVERMSVSARTTDDPDFIFSIGNPS